MDLSKKRAAAVKYYLVNVFKQPAPRMQTKGFGESKPLAPNDNPDGSDNPAGREKNRRVEFIIKTETRKEAISPGADTFGLAVKSAQDASLLVQSAKTPEDWNGVAKKWQEAIQLMKEVSASSPNYQTAQKKVGEYEKNLKYAQQNAGI
ncbi:MAG: OmpA family protein [Oscillatoria sp. Prado101]|nr:OmpA family protein [Oscillatoria sp. Prado101]